MMGKKKTPVRPAPVKDSPAAPSIDDQMPVASSMRQVVVWTGMPEDLIKALKKKGCPAFDAANRVKTGPLLRFFFAEFYSGSSTKPPEGFATWREVCNMWEAHSAEISLKKLKATVLDLPEAERRSAEAEAYYFSELDRAMREMPPALCGLSANQIHDKLGGFVKELRQRSREKFKSYAQP